MLVGDNWIAPYEGHQAAIAQLGHDREMPVMGIDVAGALVLSVAVAPLAGLKAHLSLRFLLLRQRDLVDALLATTATEHRGGNHNALALVAFVGVALTIRAQVATSAVAAGKVIGERHLSPLRYIFGSTLRSICGGCGFFLLLNDWPKLPHGFNARVLRFAIPDLAQGVERNARFVGNHLKASHV
jgi:hypothetical protein